MAEALFRKAVGNRQDYAVSSAGLSASEGSPCSRETMDMVDSLDAGLGNFSSRPVSEKLLNEATHVFAMTHGHLQILEEHFPAFSDKFYLACEFIDVPGKGFGSDVPDPIGMGKKAYQDVADALALAVPSIISYIDGTTQHEL
ncbi:MAG: hypothetical protein H7Y36_10595 [Armatimonadetes bacterium]|nr:hypothetical protein [Akkermansiaceae bacterium]